MSGNGINKATKQKLPSWMSSREGSRSHDENSECDEISSNANESAHKRAKEDSAAVRQNAEDSKIRDFSKLLDGVVFVLSGFVNPERGMLRSQALEMGAEYQPDWNSNCTLLVCAFPDTPKFRQVEAQYGTVVSKEWITECYTQKKLVDIDSHLMLAGKPWRKSNISRVLNHDDKTSPRQESQKQDKGQPCLRQETSAMSTASRGESSKCVEEKFSSTKVKKWAADDLNKTIAWLQNQDEKPEAYEIKTIAAQGVLICLQDAIDLLEQKQDLHQLMEQWNFIPRVVEELIRTGTTKMTSISGQHLLHKQALSFKKIYEDEFRKIKDDSDMKGNPKITNERKQNEGRKGKAEASNTTEYDSDETIEMTEEEIDLAFKSIASRKPRPY